MIPLVLIILLGLIFIILCIIGGLMLVKMDDIYRLLKLPGTRAGSIETESTPEGFEEVSVHETRKRLDEQVAQRAVKGPVIEEHIESYTQDLGDEIIIDENERMSK